MPASKGVASRYVTGLRELQAALVKADAATKPGIEAALFRLMNLVARRGRQNILPFSRSFDLHASIRGMYVKGRPAVGSSEPYAEVTEFGGTIHPRGVPIEIPKRRYLGDALDQSKLDIAEGAERALDPMMAAYEKGV